FGGGIDDHVHLGDDTADEFSVANVAVDERQALVRHHVAQVFKAAGVRERVEQHDLVRRLRQQIADEVGGDESGTAGHENALQPNSLSIVYKGRRSTSR